MFDYSSVIILVLLIGGFLVLARRSWRSHRKALRWLATPFLGLLSLVGLLLLGAVVYGYWEINHDRGNPVPELQVAVTPERIERGEKFAPYCSSCHSDSVDEPPIGKNFLGEGAPPVGRFWAPNLTPEHLANWTDGEIARAIREGIHRNGRGLMIMPSQLLRQLSDEDTEAIIAWLRSLPPAGEATPPNRLNALGAMMAPHVGLLRDQPPITEPVPHPEPGPNAEYGAYLYALTCALCHGEDAMGKPDWQAPPLAHIPLVYDQAQFINFMRTGQRLDGSSVDPQKMPWEDMSRFLGEDDDVRAVYAFLEEARD